MARGETICVIAQTEPGTGSDVAGVQTTARPTGDAYVLNGAKRFITEALIADLAVVVATTDPAKGRDGIALFLVEMGTPGFSRGGKETLLGVHGLARQEDLRRAPGTDEGGQEGRFDHRGHAHLDLRQSQPRAGGGGADVAGHGKLEAGAETGAVDHGDRGKGRLVDGVDGLVQGGNEDLGGGGREVMQHLHLHARREGAARSRQHRRSHARKPHQAAYHPGHKPPAQRRRGQRTHRMLNSNRAHSNRSSDL